MYFSARSILFNLFFDSQFCGSRKFSLSVRKLLFLQLAWIPPYLCFANYFERSLLPLRLMCYTQTELLFGGHRLAHGSVEGCIDKVFGESFSKSPPSSLCVFDGTFSVLKTPKLRPDLERVVVVRSAPNSFDYREYVRDTWQKKLSPDLPVIFVVGLGNDVSSECDEYGDILWTDFVDSYRNLTLKMTTTYRFLLNQFPRLKQVIVVNDDTIVNATSLRQLSSLHDTGGRYVVGKVSIGYPRLFFQNLLWYVGSDVFPHKCYPPFVQGSSFIISADAARQVIEQICKFPFVHLDDIMMGIMANCLDIEMRHKFGFDRHVLDQFVVYHYQWSRFSPEKMREQWRRANKMNIF
uniref:Hexosyltransferase n=1 Tax=Plectus sambesii TaxID=2011161 RepID=A0A914VA23_9BILA